MSTLRNILLSAIVILPGAAALAQGLSTNVAVERNIIPEERAASRLADYHPTLYSPQLPAVNLLQDEYAGTARITPGFLPLDPAPWPLALKRSKERGYASIGYLPIYNLDATAGYRFIDNDTTSVGAWMRFDGMIWHSGNKTEGRNLYRTNTVTAGADASHRFGAKSTLSAAATYSRAWLHRPGHDGEFDQGLNMASARAAWQSVAGPLDYNVALAWQTFGMTTCTPIAYAAPAPTATERTSTAAVTEHVAALLASLSGQFAGAFRAGADLSAKMQFWGDAATLTLPAEGAPYALAKSPAHNLGLFSVLPYVSYTKGTISARAGANLQISTGGSDNAFHAAPSVRFAWTPKPIAALAFNVEGGNDFNTLRSLYDYSPWLPSNFSYERSYMPLNASLALNLGPWTGLSLQLRGAYAIANNYLMPFLAEGATDGTATATFTTFLPTDLKGFTGGLTVRFHPSQVINFYASADLTQQGPEKGNYLWRDRARYVIACGAASNPISRLTVGIDWEYRGHRVCYSGADPQNLTEIHLGAVSDLSANARWDFSSRLSVFVDAHNLLCRRYQTLPGPLSPSITGRLGAAYKF